MARLTQLEKANLQITHMENMVGELSRKLYAVAESLHKTRTVLGVAERPAPRKSKKQLEKERIQAIVEKDIADRIRRQQAGAIKRRAYLQQA